MSRLLRFLTIVTITLSAGRVAAEEPAASARVDAPEVGFRLTIPEVGWVHREQRAEGRLTALAVGPSEHHGEVQLSVQPTSAADSGLAAARAAVADLRGRVASVAGISEIEDLDLEIAGHTAPGLRLVQVSGGKAFRVYLVFLRANGIQYRIQFHAPSDLFDEQWPTARRILDGFELVPLDAAGTEEVRLRRLAARCGSEVDWAKSWDDAARRAREGGRLVVVGVFAQPAFEMGDTLSQGVFMDPDVVALMKHRFVGWRWHYGLPAPFVSHDVFGLSRTTFGVGLLVCTPAGRVVRQIFILNPTLVADALRETLAEHPEAAPPSEPPEGTRAARVAFLIDSGQLDAARAALGAPVEGEVRALAYQRGRLDRVARDGASALAALDVARRAEARADGDPTTADVDFETARILVGLGENGKAARLVDQCLAGKANDAARAGMLELDAALAWAAGDRDRAKARLLELTREYPERPEAWAAAALLVGPLLKVDITPDLRWPTPVQSRLAALPEAAPASSTLGIESGLESATSWLLSRQRSDGGWDTPQGMRSTHPSPHPMTMAAQAICTLALARVARLSEEDDPVRAARCRFAARLGLARYLADRARVRDHPWPVAFMDYTCWGDSYGLFLLTGLLDPELDLVSPSKRSVLEAEAARLVEGLVRIQQPNGGWSYYVSGEVGGKAADIAMSFTTATVLLSLEAATDRGIEVPPGVLARGFASLTSLRGTNGAFEYLRTGSGPHQAGVVPPAGAAARGPVCTLALVRGGRLDPTAMQPAIETYVEHLGLFGAEARKALMHAGADTQGSHYLLYDYATAADALRATGDAVLDPETRERARAAIQREMARCRCADGSFVDNPLIGPAAGTGLAVLALIDLYLDDARR